VLAEPHRLLAGHTDALVELRRRGRTAVVGRLARSADDVAHLRERVAALSPAATLARGYAVVQGPDGAVVREPGAVAEGAALRLRLAGGDLAARAAGPWLDAGPAPTVSATTKRPAAKRPAVRKPVKKSSVTTAEVTP
jgi:exodeoxyribonuclease VII large subunit